MPTALADLVAGAEAAATGAAEAEEALASSLVAVAVAEDSNPNRSLLKEGEVYASVSPMVHNAWMLREILSFSVFKDKESALA